MNNFYAKGQKGMAYLGKFYRRDVDGEWEEKDEDHYFYKHPDLTFVKPRLCADLNKKAKSKDMSYDIIDIDEVLYFVVVYAMKDSKKYNAYIDNGFVELHGVLKGERA